MDSQGGPRRDTPQTDVKEPTGRQREAPGVNRALMMWMAPSESTGAEERPLPDALEVSRGEWTQLGRLRVGHKEPALRAQENRPTSGLVLPESLSVEHEERQHPDSPAMSPSIRLY